MTDQFIDLPDGLVRKSSIVSVIFDDYSDVVSKSNECRVYINCEHGVRLNYNFSDKKKGETFFLKIKELLIVKEV